MKLSTFRIINCFGFADSGKVELLNARNFIYVLGRNSSGKSSLLSAIRYFASGETPSEKPNFKNFEETGIRRYFEAEFVFEKSKLVVNRFENEFIHLLGENSIDHGSFLEHPPNATFYDNVIELYRNLIEKLNKSQNCLVTKFGSGNYWFESTNESGSFNQRAQAIKKFISDATNQEGYFLDNGVWRNTTITANSIESLLISQFPKIALFNERFGLSENLPNIINRNWEVESNELTKSFVRALGEELINDILTKKTPATIRDLEIKIQANANRLAQNVNSSAKNHKRRHDLVKIDILFSGDGLQITCYTNSKPCYYSQMSENTKFLFAYHLHQQTEDIKGNILIFDEPNNGFHPTAQAQLLKFLQDLAKSGNQVIVSTHSEHLIDLDYLGSVRIMDVDLEKRLIVRNHFYTKPSGKGDYLSLQPIYDAIGHHFAGQIGIKDEIVITEGVTDLLYIRAFSLILGLRTAPNLAPARGAGQIPHLLAFIVAQGFRCKVILDEGETRKNFQADYGVDDRYIYEVRVPNPFRSTIDGAGIEDLISKNDFAKILKLSDQSVPAGFSKTTNGKYMKSLKMKNAKRIVAHRFYEEAKNHQLSNFESETLENFRELLEFCRKDDWFSI